MTGLIGGINEVLMVFGVLFTGLFTEKMFNFSILSKLYQVDDSDRANNKENDIECEGGHEDKDHKIVNNGSLPIINSNSDSQKVGKLW